MQLYSAMPRIEPACKPSGNHILQKGLWSADSPQEAWPNTQQQASIVPKISQTTAKRTLAKTGANGRALGKDRVGRWGVVMGLQSPAWCSSCDLQQHHLDHWDYVIWTWAIICGRMIPQLGCHLCLTDITLTNYIKVNDILNTGKVVLHTILCACFCMSPTTIATLSL